MEMTLGLKKLQKGARPHSTAPRAGTIPFKFSNTDRGRQGVLSGELYVSQEAIAMMGDPISVTIEFKSKE